MRAKFFVALGAAALLLVALAPSASASRTVMVDDDLAQCPSADYTSIQAAVAASPAGTTILVCAGTYHEMVQPKRDDRLLAKGAPGDVVLDGDGQTKFAGFYLLDVSGVLVEGFTLREFHESSILLDGASGNTIRDNVVTLAHHDGIELRMSAGSRNGSADNLIEHNLSINNLAGNACGIQVRDAGSNHNVIRHNTSINNNWGIRIGLGATGNVVFHNDSHNNRAFGILNFAGGNNTSIENNRAEQNPTGLAVQGSSGVTAARNRLFDNTVVDLFWDGVGADTFENNHCNTSVPPGLCEHEDGNGH
jgi:parallel beta-helix repeat protein